MEKKEKKRGEENRKIIVYMIAKKAGNFRTVSQCFLGKLNESCQSWSKVSTS